MTVSTLIAAARQYTQTTGSAWVTPADELRSVNRAYRDIYEKILDANDEYFIKEVTVPLSALTVVRQNVYDYTLPSDWHRLRQLRAKSAEVETQFERLDPQDVTQIEGYRYFGNKLRLTFRGSYDYFRLEYYPTPTEYTSTATDITYPPQLEPLIIAYQIAMDIEKAQKGDPTPHAEEYARLWQRFEHATMRRDNFRYPTVSNAYRSTFNGW